MSALAAAAHELRAQASRYVVLADLLEAITCSLDYSHPPVGGETDALDRATRLTRSLIAGEPAAPVSTQPPVASPSPAPVRSPVVPTVPARPKDIVLTKPTEAARIDAAVLLALSGGPLKAAVLIARAKCSPSQLKTCLKRLRAQKLVRLVGATSMARWQLVSGATLPPTTAAGRRHTLKAVEFDTVWNGRKTDPSLLGDRTTRSSLP